MYQTNGQEKKNKKHDAPTTHIAYGGQIAASKVFAP
jgi:hypothetical protein